VVVAPASSDITLIFPFDTREKRFDRGFYSPVLTDGRLGQQELDAFMIELESLVHPSLKAIRSGVCCWYVCFLICVVFFSGLVGASIAGGGPAVFLALTVYIGFIVCSIRMRKNRTLKLLRKLKAEANKLAARHNTQLQGRGLRWHVPAKFFFWIELWKEYKGQQPPVGNVGYVPPVNYQPVPQPLNDEQNAYTQGYYVPNAYNTNPNPNPNPYPNHLANPNPDYNPYNNVNPNPNPNTNPNPYHNA